MVIKQNQIEVLAETLGPEKGHIVVVPAPEHMHCFPGFAPEVLPYSVGTFRCTIAPAGLNE